MITKEYELRKTMHMSGKAPKYSEEPSYWAVQHTELGALIFKTKDGSIVVCRECVEYRLRKPQESNNKNLVDEKVQVENDER